LVSFDQSKETRGSLIRLAEKQIKENPLLTGFPLSGE
jgi:hypothetical protein